MRGEETVLVAEVSRAPESSSAWAPFALSISRSARSESGVRSWPSGAHSVQKSKLPYSDSGSSTVLAKR